MKKTILISIATSAVLFAATVDNLNTNQVSQTVSSGITDATVNQGKTEVAGESTTVDDYNRGHEDEADTNIINNSTITGISGDNSSVKVDQGGLSVSNGAQVSDSEDKSINTIDGTSITANGSTTKVKQGNIDISGGIHYSNMDVHSTNTITGSSISSDEHDTLVTQATLEVGDANLTDNASAEGIDIDTTNTIAAESTIADSTVRQSHTEIKNGANVGGLGIVQHNTIDGGSGINDSTVTQGTTSVDSATVSGLDQNITNTMTHITSDDSILQQADLKISGTSTNVSNLDIGSRVGATHTVNANEMIDVTADSAKATQMTTNIANSQVTNLTATQKNYMGDMAIVAESTAMQGDINITDSTVSDFKLDFDNDMERVSMSAGSSAKQGLLKVGSSTATGTAEHTEIQASNKLEDTILNSSDVLQSSTSVLGGSIVSGLTMQQTNSIDKSNVSGNDNNVTGSSISQSETTVDGGSTVDTLAQDVTNIIQDVTINGATVEEAKISVNGSNVNGVTIVATNTINNDSILKGGAYVSQNGLNIQNSTVNGLSATQTNTIDGSTIDNSTLTQGDINIGGAY